MQETILKKSIADKYEFYGICQHKMHISAY